MKTKVKPLHQGYYIDNNNRTIINEFGTNTFEELQNRLGIIDSKIIEKIRIEEECQRAREEKNRLIETISVFIDGIIPIIQVIALFIVFYCYLHGLWIFKN